MRKIYLIRHGQPELPGGERICLGSSELPLSTLGRLQACLLGLELGGRVSAVFSSPLSRARDTALALAGPEDVICAWGSLYSVGEIRHHLGLC